MFILGQQQVYHKAVAQWVNVKIFCCFVLSAHPRAYQDSNVASIVREGVQTIVIQHPIDPITQSGGFPPFLGGMLLPYKGFYLFRGNRQTAESKVSSHALVARDITFSFEAVLKIW